MASRQLITDQDQTLKAGHKPAPLLIFLCVVFLTLACGTNDIDRSKIVEVVRNGEPQAVEAAQQSNPEPAPQEQPPAPEQQAQEQQPPAEQAPPEQQPEQTAQEQAPAEITNPEQSGESEGASNSRRLPWHGFRYAFVIPFLVFGIPWAIIEIFVARYIQPRSIDLTEVLIKAQDGLFIETVVSMTARRIASFAALTAPWSQVRDVVEKEIEQQLIFEASTFLSLAELESNLRDIVTGFSRLPIIDELSRDFGIEILRFNIELRYPSETVEAIKRRAEASVGGQAFVAYARAAHLDPDTAEARQLYEVFQKTSGQVDAARNLGGGITSLAHLLGRAARLSPDDDHEPDN